MQRHKLKIIVALSLILMAASACKFSFTTANISSLKTFKDKEGKTETNTFSPRDTIHAIATVSNVPDKVTLKWRFLTENVEGQPSGLSVPGTELTFEAKGNGNASYDLSPPTRGWPAGTYKIEVSMLIESGEQKDQKTTNITVTR
jgi:hypothetical protein